jgi:uncharacterized membrane protein YgcG
MPTGIRCSFKKGEDMSAANRLALMLVVLATSLFVAPGIASAQPASYITQITSALESSPVYVDPNAAPSITPDQATQLEQQIRNTGRPIYLLLIDNQEGSHFPSPGSFMNQVYQGIGKPSVVGTSTDVGFYAQGFGSLTALSSEANRLSGQLAGQVQRPEDVFSAYTQWVDAVAGLPLPDVSGPTVPSEPPVATAAAPNSSPDSNWGYYALIFLAVLALIALGFFLVYKYNRKNRRNTSDVARKGRLTLKRDNLNDNLHAMYGGVQLHPDAEAAYGAAKRAVRSADASLDSGNLDDAQRHLAQANHHYQNARATIDGRHDPRPFQNASARNHGQRSSSASSVNTRVRQTPGAVRVQRPDDSAVAFTTWGQGTTPVDTSWQQPAPDIRDNRDDTPADSGGRNDGDSGGSSDSSGGSSSSGGSDTSSSSD